MTTWVLVLLILGQPYSLKLPDQKVCAATERQIAADTKLFEVGDIVIVGPCQADVAAGTPTARDHR
jgi:hypothetical protein